MRVLLTGAGGFVGANIAAVLAPCVAELAAAGHGTAHLFAADYQPPDGAVLRFLAPHAQHVTWLTLDVRSRTELRHAVTFNGITHIVHGAAVTVPEADEAARAEEIVDINLGGTINLLAAAAAAPSVARVLVLSSSGVYEVPPPESQPGAHRGGVAAQQEDGVLDLGNLYSITKYSAELLAARYASLTGKPMAAVRLSAVYGPLERPRPTRPGTSTMYALMAALREKRPITVGGPSVGRDWTYAQDIGRAVASLLAAPTWNSSVYNASCGVRTTFAEVVAAFAAHGLQARWVSTSPGGVDTADVAMRPSQERAPLDIGRLQRDTGFSPAYGLSAGIAAWLAVEPQPTAS
jgi:nucleoside-diphosphate-sugar epimerase